MGSSERLGVKPIAKTWIIKNWSRSRTYCESQNWIWASLSGYFFVPYRSRLDPTMLRHQFQHSRKNQFRWNSILCPTPSGSAYPKSTWPKTWAANWPNLLLHMRAIWVHGRVKRERVAVSMNLHGILSPPLENLEWDNFYGWFLGSLSGYFSRRSWTFIWQDSLSGCSSTILLYTCQDRCLDMGKVLSWLIYGRGSKRPCFSYLKGSCW